MLAIERRREILSRLTADGKVIVTELAREFGVTEETIRRDLDRLDKEGLASKTYGGAVSKHGSALDLPYNIRESVNIVEKSFVMKVNVSEPIIVTAKDLIGESLYCFYEEC